MRKLKPSAVNVQRIRKEWKCVKDGIKKSVRQ